MARRLQRDESLVIDSENEGVATLSLVALAGLLVTDDGSTIAAGAFFREPAPLQPTARAPEFELVPMFRYWRASPSGDVTITLGGRTGSGSRIDFARDLDLGATNSFEGGLALDYGNHQIAVRYDPTLFHGDASLGQPVVHHGTTFPAGARVSSDVDVALVLPQYEYRAWSSADTALQAGFRGYIWTFDSELNSTGAEGVLHESRQFTHFLPAGILAFEKDWRDMALEASLAGGLLSTDRYVADVEGGIGWRPFGGRVRIDFGYGWLHLGFHETTNLGTVTAYGPLVSLEARFSL